jgi:hypothetical protein
MLAYITKITQTINERSEAHLSNILWAHGREEINNIKFLPGISRQKRLLGRARYRWEVILLKQILEKWGLD